MQHTFLEGLRYAGHGLGAEADTEKRHNPTLTSVV